MSLHSLKRSLTSRWALLPWGALCYGALFGVMIYSLAGEARLDAWRESSAQAAAAPRVLVTASTEGASCAELAGMGQKLCNAESRMDAVRDRFRQRVAARLQRPVIAPVAAVRRLQERARAPAERIVPDLAAATVEVPAQAHAEQAPNPTIATRD